MGFSDILAMLMQHGGGGGGGPPMMSPNGPATSAAPASMLPGTDLPTPQPMAHMNAPSVGQAASQMPQMSQRPSFLQGLGSAMQGGQQGGLFGNWTQPTGAGLSAAQSPQPMMHNSGILQSLMAEPQQRPNPMGGGLHELLMRLGLMQPQQQ